MSEVLFKRFERNDLGRDFAVGDIHGHFSQLQKKLDEIGFNQDVDRLFSVGDLVDRGPECELSLEWIDRPWFHPVRGNHDDYVCRYDTCDIRNWFQNGGIWFSALTSSEMGDFAVTFRDLPVAIEVETKSGLVGLVHADCPFPSWSALRKSLGGGDEGGRLRSVKNYCMWSRGRIENSDTSGVYGVRALVVGHTPNENPVTLGNVYHIDTMGWRPQHGGRFTIIDLETLEFVL